MPKRQGVISQWPVLNATPSTNPPAGHIYIYVKATDGKLYTKNSSGVEAVVDTTGGGAALAAVQTGEPTSPATGALWLDTDESAAGWNGALVITLGVSDPIPAGLPAGSVIVRRTS